MPREAYSCTSADDSGENVTEDMKPLTEGTGRTMIPWLGVFLAAVSKENC